MNTQYSRPVKRLIRQEQFLYLPIKVILILISSTLIVLGSGVFPLAQPHPLILFAGIAILVVTILFFLQIGRIKNNTWLQYAAVAVYSVLIGLLPLSSQQWVFPIVSLLTLVLVIGFSMTFPRKRVGFLFLFIVTIINYLTFDLAPALNPIIRWLSFLLVPLVGTSFILVSNQNRIIMDRELKNLKMVNEISYELSSSLKVEEVCTAVGNSLRRIFKADTFFVCLLEDSQLNLQYFYDLGVLLEKTMIPKEGTLAGYLIDSGQGLLLNNFKKQVDELNLPFSYVGEKKLSGSWMGAPMIHNRKAVGVVAVASYSYHAFQERDLELIRNLAMHASLAIEKAYQHSRVEYQSRIDSLTDVFNHGSIIEILENEIQKAVGTGKQTSIIMLDIDDFKNYNDRWGHLTGDQLLIALTSVIKKTVKNSDFVGRWGGEEFLVVLPETTAEQAGKVAHRIADNLRNKNLTNYSDEIIPTPTVSQGIATCPNDARQPFDLIDKADIRLYEAKLHGKNQVCLKGHKEAPTAVEIKNLEFLEKH